MARFTLVGQSIQNFRRIFLFLLCRCHSAELSLKCNTRKSTWRNIPLLLKTFHFSPCIHIYAWQLITLKTYCIKRLELMKSSFSVFLAKKSSLDSLSQNGLVLLKLHEISEQANINIDKGKKICQLKQSNLGMQLVFPVYFQSHYKFTVCEGTFSRWNLNFCVERVINPMNAIWWEHLCICDTLQSFPCELKLAHARLLQQIFALKSCRTQVQVWSNQLRLARWVTAVVKIWIYKLLN